MPKYLVHYKPAGFAKDVRAVIDAPSYRATLTQIRHTCWGVTVYSVKPMRPADVTAAIGETNGNE